MTAPTDREMEILQVLWRLGEGTVRQVYEELRAQNRPVVQNTVQTFLRMMESRKMVDHRVEGRSFVYRPLIKRSATRKEIASNVLQRTFDGAIDQMVRSAFDAKTPTRDELDHLQSLIDEARENIKRKKH